jgi:S1-C subfamily serine protease
MDRPPLVCCLALAAWLVSPVAADNPAFKEALALQDAMQAAIQDAEPAIACILVSRSDDYIKLKETPTPDGTGRLGGFDLSRAGGRVLGTDPDLVKKLDMKNAGYVPEAFGSGVVIDESGLVLTNEHVVRNATKIFVRLPGDKGSYADIHAADPRSDLAVLKLIEPVGKLKAIKLGDGGKARKGQWVLSLANPFAAGFRDGAPSASWGIISNVRRRPAGSPNELDRINKSLYQHGILIQSDVKLNVGCSGGALIDLRGELIGLTTALAAITGTETSGGYSIPIDAGMKRIIEVLKRGEEVEYGFLGVSLYAQDERRPEAAGIPIKGTVEASPAWHKGLQPGDLIVSVNGAPVHENDDLYLTIGTLLAGTEVRLEILRARTPLTVTLTLDKFVAPGKLIASRKPAMQRGLRVDYLSVLMQSLHPSAQPKGITQGVIVREVQTGSPAAQALLKVNDIITHIKGKPVSSPADFYRQMQNLNGPVELRLANSHQVTLN